MLPLKIMLKIIFFVLVMIVIISVVGLFMKKSAPEATIQEAGILLFGLPFTGNPLKWIKKKKGSMPIDMTLIIIIIFVVIAVMLALWGVINYKSISEGVWG